MLSDTDSKIKEYEDKFTELKGQFQLRATLRTEITVLRILDVVKTFSEYSQIYDLFTYSHLPVTQQKTLS